MYFCLKKKINLFDDPPDASFLKTPQKSTTLITRTKHMFSRDTGTPGEKRRYGKNAIQVFQEEKGHTANDFYFA